MKRFILGMIPSLIILNAFAIASLFTTKAESKPSEFRQPVKGILCEVGKPMWSCKPMDGKTRRVNFRGKIIEISQESGIVEII